MGTSTRFNVAAEILGMMRLPALALAAVTVTACAGRTQPAFAEAPTVRCEDGDERCAPPQTRVIRYRSGCPLPNATDHRRGTVTIDDCPGCGMG